jgi:dipeptidyl-peptidase-3
MTERFADIQILRYQVPGFEKLSLSQKQLAYYLYKAGLSGRDIFYDQNYKHNLRVRKTLETVLGTYKGNKETEDYKKFVAYAKRIFFSNGLHHHYSNIKMLPEFSFEYFKELIAKSDQNKLPLEGKSLEGFTKFLQPILFDANVDAKLVDLSDSADNVKASTVNFYEGATEKEVEEFYAARSKPGVKNEPSWGLNSKVVKEDGRVREKIWRVGGMYSPAIEKIAYWLEKAMGVAENDAQRRTLRSLIEYYRTGDLAKFDEYSILWVKDTESLIDAVNGFIEVYHDPLQKKGSYESVVSMKDLEATKRIAAISKEAQWFEDHSPIITQHKKKNVTGISAKVIIVIGEAGDAAPTTPIGINLPNAEWIREQHGSKSVSLGNIVAAYNYVKAKSPSIQEFGFDQEVVARVKKYGALASDLHTDMHEVIGHASGQIDSGVGTTDQTLKNYAGTLEEARADLVALYYTLDAKLIEMGVMPSLEVGKAEYDSYILNGLLTQLFKIKPGENLEEAHMRNRQLVSAWAYKQGRADNVIEKVIREGKTFYKINDYEKLRQQFGRLLREIQRIKSEGDFEAGKQLVETYGVKVDQELLQEVHKRYEPLNIAPYMGFIQPRLVPVMNGDQITDVRVEYPIDFLEQMLEYGRDYSLLPLLN